jgi:alkanesulfonate monooxygenase
MKNISIRSKDLKGAEIAWFAPICNGDDALLSAHDMRYKSNWKNASNILLKLNVE